MMLRLLWPLKWLASLRLCTSNTRDQLRGSGLVVDLEKWEAGIDNDNTQRMSSEQSLYTTEY